MPEWIDGEAWNGFVEMRRSIKKPMTARAAQLLVRRLDVLRCEGHDVNACLDQSTLNAWQGVFAIKADSQLSFRERDAAKAKARIREMTGGVFDILEQGPKRARIDNG